MPSKCTFILFGCLMVFGNCWEDVTKIFVPCKKTDMGCIKKTAQVVYQNIIHGFPSLGIPSSEQIYQHDLSGKLDGLYFNFTDTTTTGFEHCDINHIKLDLNNSCLDVELACETFTLVGEYVTKGELFNLKLEENGKFKIFCRKYKIRIESKIILRTADGCKHYLELVDLHTYCNAEEKITVKLNGDTDGSRLLECYVNTNWRQAVGTFQSPFIAANINTLAIRTNEFLKNICLDHMFLF